MADQGKSNPSKGMMDKEKRWLKNREIRTGYATQPLVECALGVGLTEGHANAIKKEGGGKTKDREDYWPIKIATVLQRCCL